MNVLLRITIGNSADSIDVDIHVNIDFFFNLVRIASIVWCESQSMQLDTRSRETEM
jgi:hypothetical protein